MTANRNEPPTLVDFPTEVLVRVFDFVDHRSLSTARLVCKRFSDAATRRFAIVNFTETVHVVSPYSIDTLVSITEHPVFGGYVKTVAICSTRRTKLSLDTHSFTASLSEQVFCINAYVKTRRFARRVETRLRQHQISLWSRCHQYL
jgi:hypothetical protein